MDVEKIAYHYAVDLATAIWERHYKHDAPQWEPLDATIGVLTQIDNMVCGMSRDMRLGFPDMECSVERY